MRIRTAAAVGGEPPAHPPPVGGRSIGAGGSRIERAASSEARHQAVGAALAQGRAGSRRTGVAASTAGFRLRNQQLAVEAQMVAVAAQEADGVGSARHRSDIACLERRQKGRPDPQVGGDVLQLLAARQARRPQLLADRRRRDLATSRASAGACERRLPWPGLDPSPSQATETQRLIDGILAKSGPAWQLDPRLRGRLRAFRTADRRSAATPRRDPGRRPAAARAGCDRAGRAGRAGSDRARAASRLRSMALTGPTSLGRQREVVDAEPDQGHGLERPARHLAAHRQPHARTAAALDHVVEEAQGRRREHVVAVDQGRVAAVAGEQELEQVVAADRQEVDPLAAARSAASRATAPRPWPRPRSASAARSPRAAARSSSMSQQAPRRLQLGDLGHHREHDLQVPARRRHASARAAGRAAWSAGRAPCAAPASPWPDCPRAACANRAGACRCRHRACGTPPAVSPAVSSASR